MDNLFCFALGMTVGGIIGFVACALLTANGEDGDGDDE